jgi:hypothetical protein
VSPWTSRIPASTYSTSAAVAPVSRTVRRPRPPALRRADVRLIRDTSLTIHGRRNPASPTHGRPPGENTRKGITIAPFLTERNRLVPGTILTQIPPALPPRPTGTKRAERARGISTSPCSHTIVILRNHERIHLNGDPIRLPIIPILRNSMRPRKMTRLPPPFHLTILLRPPDQTANTQAMRRRRNNTSSRVRKPRTPDYCEGARSLLLSTNRSRMNLPNVRPSFELDRVRQRNILVEIRSAIKRETIPLNSPHSKISVFPIDKRGAFSWIWLVVKF